MIELVTDYSRSGGYYFSVMICCRLELSVEIQIVGGPGSIGPSHAEFSADLSGVKINFLRYREVRSKLMDFKCVSKL